MDLSGFSGSAGWNRSIDPQISFPCDGLSIPQQNIPCLLRLFVGDKVDTWISNLLLRVMEVMRPPSVDQTTFLKHIRRRPLIEETPLTPPTVLFDSDMGLIGVQEGSVAAFWRYEKKMIRLAEEPDCSPRNVWTLIPGTVSEPPNQFPLWIPDLEKTREETERLSS